MAEEQAKARAAEFKAWVHSHTPEQIYDANLARLHLRRIIRESTGKVPPNTRKIIDDRHVPRPATAFARFFGERKSSGDMKGISTRESGKLISEEWKAMSESEKKVLSPFPSLQDPSKLTTSPLVLRRRSHLRTGTIQEEQPKISIDVEIPPSSLSSSTT